MIKLSEKGRKILRTVFRGLGVTAISFIFQACYGMPPDWGDDVTILGSVKSGSTNKPIPGIKVSIENTSFNYQTDIGGNFIIYIPKQDGYTVIFEDIDGPENGGLFKPQIRRLPAFEGDQKLSVFLEEADEE